MEKDSKQSRTKSSKHKQLGREREKRNHKGSSESAAGNTSHVGSREVRELNILTSPPAVGGQEVAICWHEQDVI